MTKPISTRMHGVIDYTWAATASALAQQMNGATSTARLLRRASRAATATSLITDYESGAVRLLPMKGHLAMDAALCGVLLASPMFLPASERSKAAIPVLLGAIGLVAGLLTRTQPDDRREEFGVFGGGELESVADRDPDIAAAPHLRPLLE